MRFAAGIAIVIVVASGLSGCAHTYEQFRTAGAPGSPPTLSPTAEIYVAVPADGRYGTKEYRGSGHMTANSLESALVRHARRVAVGGMVRPVDEVVAEARSKGFTYVVYPVILHWEDRATEWSGKPDRIEIKLTLIATESAEVRDEIIIKGKSRWATFGGDHPQDLLPEPIVEYVARLFGSPSAK